LTGASQSNLTAGTYLVNVTDGNNCSKIDTVIVAQPQAISDALTATNPLCHGSATGSIALSAQGGTGALSYQWNPAISSLNNLNAGTYNLTVIDANNCQHTDAVTLTEPSAISTQNQVTNVLCHNGGSTGAATVTPAGGTGTYTYLWNTGAQTNTLSNVAAGTYTVAVTDANSCAYTDTVVIAEPATGISTSTSSTTAHTGGTDGTATVTATGGTGTLSYHWNTTPIQTTATASNLAGGTYTVLVTDANGCSTTANVTVAVYTAINDVKEITNLSIYPNPASSNLTVVLSLEKASDISIEIRDILGRIVTTRTFANEMEIRSSIDVSSWAAAVYTVQIKTANNLITKEVTIQH
jgi:hypothetical protein